MSWPRRIVLASSDPQVAADWAIDGRASELAVAYDGVRGTVADPGGRIVFATSDPFALLAWMEANLASDGTPTSRWVGYIGYEFNRSIEPLPPRAISPGSLPTFAFWRVEPGVNELMSGLPADYAAKGTVVGRSLSRDAYLAATVRAIDYIAAGDVFQINLSQQFTVQSNVSAADAWSRLQRDTPARYGAYLDTGDAVIVSNSPELFFRIEPQPDGTRRIVSRPVKGTRPDLPGMRDALEHSSKDRAELAMIVDLQRNDLGRVCEIGSVRVLEPRVIERHPTVLHGVATIDGTLRRELGFADVVRALFPCGSITGCPKIRAMQIINELEPIARGPYCGTIGYLTADGSAAFNVAIRTMVMRDGVARVCVGGGIVADSTPLAEYDETIVKARAMLDALGVRQID